MDRVHFTVTATALAAGWRGFAVEVALAGNGTRDSADDRAIAIRKYKPSGGSAASERV